MGRGESTFFLLSQEFTLHYGVQQSSTGLKTGGKSIFSPPSSSSRFPPRGSLHHDQLRSVIISKGGGGEGRAGMRERKGLEDTSLKKTDDPARDTFHDFHPPPTDPPNHKSEFGTSFPLPPPSPPPHPSPPLFFFSWFLTADIEQLSSR